MRASREPNRIKQDFTVKQHHQHEKKIYVIEALDYIRNNPASIQLDNFHFLAIDPADKSAIQLLISLEKNYGKITNIKDFELLVIEALKAYNHLVPDIIIQRWPELQENLSQIAVAINQKNEHEKYRSAQEQARLKKIGAEIRERERLLMTSPIVSTNDKLLINKFFEFHPDGPNTYWTKERKKSATIEQIIDHALGKHKSFFGNSGASTKTVLIKNFDVDFKLLNNPSVSKNEKETYVREKINGAIPSACQLAL